MLVPTRELADQVHATIAPLARLMGLRATTVYGGVGYGPQISTLRKGVDILVACPGRLEDLLKRRALRLDNVEITILDEADHMTELGFLQPVRRILDQTPRDGQRLLFSATLDKRTDALVRYLDKPVTHSVESAAEEANDMEHHVFNVTDADKNAVVRELASGLGKTVLFTRTKHAASRLAKQLSVAGVPAVDLHGNLAQNARRRNLAAFTDGEVRVLVATDIAARGIHVDDIAIVVHVDPPEEHKAYLHRSGRTARAGARGLVVTVATPAQRGAVTSMTRRAGIKPKATHVKPGSPAITELTGPCAPVEHRRIISAPAPERSYRRPAQGRPAQGRPAQGRPAQGRSTQGRSEEGRPSQGRSGQGRSVQGRPTHARPTEGRPAQGRSTRGRSTGNTGRRG